MGAMKDEEIVQSLQIGSATVERVRRLCGEEGVEAQGAIAPPEETGWFGGGSFDSLSLLSTVPGTGQLDPVTAGGPAGEM